MKYLKWSKGLIFSVTFPLLGVCIQASAFDQPNGFSMTPFLEKCGGKIYPKCDDSSLNQETIFKEAQKKAIEKGLDLMLVIGADWCPSCKKFDKMLKNDKASDQFFQQVILVNLDGDLKSTKNLSEKLGISYFGYPQAFTFKPKNLEFQKSFYPSMLKDVQAVITELDLESSKKKVRKKPLSIGVVQAKTLELPIELNNDYGKSYFVSSVKDDYDRYINQGVSALHLFQYVDAYRSFNMAVKKDKDRVMAYVGQILSIIQISKGDEARFFIETALEEIERIKKDKGLSEKELAWADVARSLSLAAAMSYSKEDKEKAKSPVRAILELKALKDKENLDGIALLHWLHPSGFDRPQRQRVFEEALQKNPDSVGPRHYLLHLAEMRNDLREAEKHGAILKDLAPGSGHAVHMYGHTLPQRGQWQEAVNYFLKAHDIHLRWAKKNGVSPNEDWHYSHNLDLLAAAYLGLGKFDKAIEAWMEAARYDFRAVLHAVQLYIVKDDVKNADALMANFESYNATYINYFAPYRKELELNPKKLREESSGFQAQPKTYFDALMGAMKQSFVSDQPLTPQYYEQASNYFSSRFQSGGFDGWSNAYLEFLRLKRMAKILSFDDFAVEMKPLEFAVTSGSLCGSGDKAKSLVKCLPE